MFAFICPCCSRTTTLQTNGLCPEQITVQLNLLQLSFRSKWKAWFVLFFKAHWDKTLNYSNSLLSFRVITSHINLSTQNHYITKHSQESSRAGLWGPLLYSIWTHLFNLAFFKSFTNCKDFPYSLNGKSGRASHLMYKFGKQITRCNNSQIKILNLFEFPHVLAA